MLYLTAADTVWDTCNVLWSSRCSRDIYLTEMLYIGTAFQLYELSKEKRFQLNIYIGALSP